MKVSQKKYSKLIATLGPNGTDSEAMAKKVGDKIVLQPSFEAAMNYAYRKDTYALVPCGYKKIEDAQIVDTWVDLSFRFMNKMKVVKIYCEDVKPMAIAIRSECNQPKTLIIHPATEEFRKLVKGSVITHYASSKPEAVRLTAEGKYDMCIGSKDFIRKYTNLKIIRTFKPQMVWALYERLTQ